MRLIKKLLHALSLCFVLVLPVSAEESFQVALGTIDIPERGVVETLVVCSDGYCFNFIPPARHTLEVEQMSRKAVLCSQDGVAIITVQITTNSPAVLPDEAILRERVQKNYPGGLIFFTGSCVTGSGSGKFVEVQRVSSSGARLRTRQVFVPFAKGTVEISLTVQNAAYEKQFPVFSSLLGSFRIQASQRPAAIKP